MTMTTSEAPQMSQQQSEAPALRDSVMDRIGYPQAPPELNAEVVVINPEEPTPVAEPASSDLPQREPQAPAALDESRASDLVKSIPSGDRPKVEATIKAEKAAEDSNEVSVEKAPKGSRKGKLKEVAKKAGWGIVNAAGVAGGYPASAYTQPSTPGEVAAPVESATPSEAKVSRKQKKADKATTQAAKETQDSAVDAINPDNDEWTKEIPAEPRYLDKDVAPAPAEEKPADAEPADKPIELVTVEDVEKDKAKAAQDARPESTVTDTRDASQKIGAQLGAVLAEARMPLTLGYLEEASDDDAKKLSIPARARVNGGDEDRTAFEHLADFIGEPDLEGFTMVSDEESEAEVAQKLTLRERMKNGMTRAKLLMRGNAKDAFARSEKDGSKEQGNGKRNAIIAVGAVAVAAGGAYLAYKAGWIGNGGGGKSDMGRIVSEAAGKVGDNPPRGGGGSQYTPEQMNQLFDGLKAAAENKPKMNLQPGDMPWDTALRSGVAEQDVKAFYDQAAQNAGATITWHGEGAKQWFDVNGQSDTFNALKNLGLI